MPPQNRSIRMDAAMGSALLDRGVPIDALAHAVQTHPQDVHSVHQAHIQAGAEAILTATFGLASQIGGSGWRAPTLQQLAQNAIEQCRAHSPKFVFFDLGPFEHIPDNPDAFVQSLSQADGILIETIARKDLLSNALRLAGTPTPIIVSMSYRRDNHQGIITWDAATPAEIATIVRKSEASIIGSNCGFEIGLTEMQEIVRQYRDHTDKPMMIRMNAGSPTRTHTGWTYPLTPTAFAEAIAALQERDVEWVGGCCGITAEHLRVGYGQKAHTLE